MSQFPGNDPHLNKVQYPLKYMMEFNFFGDESYTPKDVISYSVIRSPITKLASFVSASINITMPVYTKLHEHLARNNFPDVVVKCWIVKNEDIFGERWPPKVEDVFEKNFKCICINPLESVIPKAPYVAVNMTLVHPILFYLQGTNGYNKILEDKTPLEAIEDYEKWLTEKFSNQAFQFTKVGETYEQNKFKYEQILTRNATDLMIPSVIINNYKPWNTFGYYFFDDFRLNSDATADITGYLINLGNKNEFKPIDVYKYGDFALGLRLESQTPITDPFGALYQRNPSITTKSYEMQFGFRKATGTRDLPQISISRQDGKHGSQLGTAIIKSKVSLKSEEPTEETIVYGPDDHETALNRFDKTSLQLRDLMLSLDTYQLRDSSIDYLQFNQKYNIDPHVPKAYDYIPLTICNNFVRETGMVPVLVHHVQFQMIRYRADDQSKKNKEGQY